MKRRLLILSLTVFLIGFFSGCTTHYDMGMKAYQEKDYPKAVNELNQVKKEHPKYGIAASTLTKAEFRVSARAVRDSKSSTEAIGNMRNMIALALRSKSKDLISEAFQIALEQLKSADNADYVKEIIRSLIVILKEQGDTEKVFTTLKELTFKVKDFIFNSEMRSTIKEALGEIKSLGSK